LSSQIEIQKVVDLISLEKLDEAETGILKLLDLEKNNFLLFNIYGVILLKKNNLDFAINQFKKSIEINPKFPDAYYNVGTILLKSAKFKDALPYFKEAISVKKDYFEAHFNLAETYKSLEMINEAISSYKECLKYQINDFETYNNLGLIYYKLKKIDYALFNFQKCLEINPDFFQAYNNIGVVYLDINQLDNAIISFNKCINIKMDFVSAYNNLGMALHRKKKYLAAVSILEKGLAINDKFTNLYENLANSLKFLGRNLEAIDIIEKKILIKNKDPEVFSNLASNYCSIGNISEGIKYYKKSLDLNQNPKTLTSYVFNLNYLNNMSFSDYFNAISRINNSYKKYHIQGIENKNTAKNNKKINLGFVSGDFREHAVSYQIYDVIKYLASNSDFELYAYYNETEEDDLTRKFKDIFNFWRNIKNINDSVVLNQIKSDEIKILIDLSGYTDGGRLELFYNKPATIQISWAGYLASTGLSQIDYIIGDNYIANNINEKDQFVEKIWKMKNTWSVLVPTSNTPTKSIPAKINGYITFGSFNNLKKINHKIIKLWSRILCQCNNSKLLLKTFQFKDETFKKYFAKFFINEGVKFEQLIFEEDSSRNKLLDRYNSVDISLDPFPYSGGTTNFESIFMCVPILTKKGNTFLSKCGESINSSIGLQDWIAENEEDYVLKAVNFSKNIDELQKVKNYLFDNRNTFKIFDSKGFADELSSSFKSMLGLK